MEDAKVWIQALTEKLKAVKAKDIMTAAVISTKADVKLADLAESLSQARISGVPVVDDGSHLIGIITATDLFNVMDGIMNGEAVEGSSVTSNPTVGFAMQKDVITINKETTLYEIVQIMSSKAIHTLPVLEDGRLTGIVGRHDVFKNFYKKINEL